MQVNTRLDQQELINLFYYTIFTQILKHIIAERFYSIEREEKFE